MTLLAGTIASLQAAREKTPYGYFLTDGTEDVLLPFSETTREVKQGERIHVFLFHDTQGRLTATMHRPLLLYNEVGLLEVADVTPSFGYFLEYGLGRQLLLPRDELPELESLHPNVGDKVYVRVSRDKQGRLLAKLAGETELAELSVRAPSSWKNTWVEAIVYKPLQIGSFVVCSGGVLGFGVIGFIHADERTFVPRLGQAVKVRVVHVRDDGRVNLSMRETKQIGRVEDADRLLAFLRERPNGAMPYSDETPADIIKQRFGLSKSAFKRALGKLMKERLVVQKGSWTYLQEHAPEEDRGDGLP